VELYYFSSLTYNSSKAPLIPPLPNIHTHHSGWWKSRKGCKGEGQGCLSLSKGRTTVPCW